MIAKEYLRWFPYFCLAALQPGKTGENLGRKPYGRRCLKASEAL